MRRLPFKYLLKQRFRNYITRPEDFLSLVPNVNYVTSTTRESFSSTCGPASVRFAESAVAVVIDGVQLATSNEFNQDFLT